MVVFVFVQEPRKKLLQSTKLKPIMIGVSYKGIMRMDPKTKDILDTWDFQVLKNWAYSRRTFVLVSPTDPTPLSPRSLSVFLFVCQCGRACVCSIVRLKCVIVVVDCLVYTCTCRKPFDGIDEV